MNKTDSIKSDDARHAEEALQSILKAKKNLRLYPVNNPIYTQMATDTYRKVMRFFDYADTMDLTISRSDIKLGGEVVFHAEGNEDNLALFFFRDGLRSLTINSTLSEDELLDFMDVISKDLDQEGIEDDLVTLLWEKEFQSITYKVDDSDLVEEDDNYDHEAEAQAKDGANEQDGLNKAYADATEDEESAKAIVPITVTDEDLAKLEREIEEDRKSKFPKLVEILFEMLYSSDSISEFKDVIDIISNAVDFSIRHANLSSAISIFRRVREVLERTKTPEAKVELEKFLKSAGSAEIIKNIGEWLDSKKGINEAVFKDYVSILGPAAIPHFISLLGSLNTIAGRKAAIYALSVMGKKDFKSLTKGLEDKRWFVVRNIIVTFRSIGDKRALDFLPKVIRHPEPRVRKEAIKLYGDMGGPAAVVHVMEHLYSDELSVEVVAAQALSKVGTEAAKAALIEKITGKGFQELELSAMKPFFESLARFRALDVFDFLMNMLGRKPFFGRSKYNEMMACAMYALGLMGSPKALPALEEHLASKDKIVSDYAATAIKRIRNAQRK